MIPLLPEYAMPPADVSDTNPYRADAYAAYWDTVETVPLGAAPGPRQPDPDGADAYAQFALASDE